MHWTPLDVICLVFVVGLVVSGIVSAMRRKPTDDD